MKQTTGMTHDEVEMLKVLSDGKPHSNNQLAMELKWSQPKVYRVRKKLEDRGLLTKKKDRNTVYYTIIASAAVTFLVSYGIMDYRNKRLQTLLMQEQNARIQGDVELDTRMTKNEMAFTQMIADIAERQNLNYIETMQLVTDLQNEDAYLEDQILRNYNLTTADIAALRTDVNLNDLYYRSQFTQSSMERGYLRQSLSEQSGRITAVEDRPYDIHYHIYGDERDEIEDKSDNKKSSNKSTGKDWFEETGTPESRSPEFGAVTVKEQDKGDDLGNWYKRIW